MGDLVHTGRAGAATAVCLDTAELLAMQEVDIPIVHSEKL